MKKTNLVDLMQRYVTGQVTEQEKKKIEAWLDVKKTDEGSRLVLDPADEERLFRKIVANIDNVDKIRTLRPRGAGRKLFARPWLKVAASILLIAMASYTIWFFDTGTSSHQSVSTITNEKAILADGSIVWLQKESRLTYDYNADARAATFTGEGLFEVAKDRARPFTIACGPVRVMVVGTSFNIKSIGDVFELRVLTGEVHLSSEDNTLGTVVKANEIAMYTASGITKAPMPQDELAAIVAATEYNMKFRNTPLENILSRIESKFEVVVRVEDPLVKKCRVTADFTDNSLRSTLQMLAELLEIEFSINGRTVNLSGKGCN